MGFGVDSSLMFEPLKMIICVRDRVDGVIADILKAPRTPGRGPEQ